MSEALRHWRERMPQEPVLVEPKAGEKWRLPTESNPWPSPEYRPVKILEVKDGWVKYRINEIFPDERRRMDDFLKLYRPVPQTPDLVNNA